MPDKTAIMPSRSIEPNERPSFEEICNELESNNYKLVDLDDSEINDVRLFVEKHKKRIPKY